MELTSYWFPEDIQVEPQDSVPYTFVPLKNSSGDWRSDDTVAQDHIAWILQGSIAQRQKEKLGESDRGVILYRKLLMDQMDVVQQGGEPLNVIRDSALNTLIHVDQEGWAPMGKGADIDELARYGSKMRGRIVSALEQTQFSSTGSTA